MLYAYSNHVSFKTPNFILISDKEHQQNKNPILVEYTHSILTYLLANKTIINILGGDALQARYIQTSLIPKTKMYFIVWSTPQRGQRSSSAITSLFKHSLTAH